MTAAERVSLLEAHGVGRRKPNGNGWLLREIDLSLHGGSRLAVVGATGSGKTLLMRALARLDSTDVGEILWRGAPIQGNAIPRFRRQAIYLQQRPALVEGTVEDNLRLPFTLRVHRQEAFSAEAVLSLLAEVDRTRRFLKRSTRDLSGGEAQIVALLRAIQLRPTVMLLDEPTAALDDASTRMIERLIGHWFDERPSERAFVWVSHNREQVARVAREVMTMIDGRLSDGTRSRPEQAS